MNGRVDLKDIPRGTRNGFGRDVRNNPRDAGSTVAFLRQRYLDAWFDFHLKLLLRFNFLILHGGIAFGHGVCFKKICGLDNRNCSGLCVCAWGGVVQ